LRLSEPKILPVLVDNGTCYSREKRTADDTIKAFYSIS
jgi:hypothetical protein